MSKKQYNYPVPPHVVKDVLKQIRKIDGVRKAGRELDLSPSYISMLLNKGCNVPACLAMRFGWEMKVNWRKNDTL